MEGIRVNRIFRPTEKPYYLLTDTSAFLTRAEELGYRNVSLLSPDMTDSEIQKLNKCIVRILYDPDCPAGLGECVPWLRVRETDYSDFRFNFAGYHARDGKIVMTIEDALSYIPEPKKLEHDLQSGGYIPTEDYWNRCGNCQEVLREGDRYCPYCGTPRGEVAFDPLLNLSAVLYGAPIKTKYRCSACGFLWIDYCVGSRNVCYCPRCGKTPVAVEARTQIMFTSDTVIGMVEPFSEENRPVLFSEEEVRAILDSRRMMTWSVTKHALRKRVISVLDWAGVAVRADQDAEKEHKPIDDQTSRTETEAEQINLALRMLQMEGDCLEGYPDVQCDHCGSRMVAAIRYENSTLRKKFEIEQEPMLDGETPLVCPAQDEDIHMLYGYGKKAEGYERPAYVCLRCGKRFGSVWISDNCWAKLE